MQVPRMFSQKGWRRAGVANVVLVSALGIILLIILLISTQQSDSPFTLATIFYQGHCDTTSKIDLTLHLVINIISSAILASSNCFIQVLTAPSREEIDKAHLYLVSLDIGLPLVKNFRFVSLFKRNCWIIFF
jgi:hypothetical protein